MSNDLPAAEPEYGPPPAHDATPTGFARIVTAEELLSGDPVGLGREWFDEVAASIPAEFGDVVGPRANMRTD